MRSFHDIMNPFLSFFQQINLEKQILGALFLIMPFFLKAQTVIEPEWLTIEDGLSQGYVRSIIQDSQGFIWIGTKNGLNRFDGEKFKIFTHDPADPYSISDDFVLKLQEMGKFILVGTDSKGLNLFHKWTHRFYSIPLDPSKPDDPTIHHITNIQKDRLGQIWLSTANPHRLYRLQFPANFQSRFPQDESLLDSINIQEMSNLGGPYASDYAVQKDHMLVVNIETEKLWKIDIQSGEESLFEEQPLLKYPISSYLQSLSNGDLVVKPGPSSNEIYLFKDSRWNTIPSDVEYDFLFTVKEQKQIWLSNNSKSVFIYDEKSLDNKLLQRQNAIATFPLNNVALYDVKTDQSGNVWASTAGYGVLKITQRQIQIKTYFEGRSIYNPPFASEKGDIAISNLTTSELLLVPNQQSKVLNLLFPEFEKNLSSISEIEAGTELIFSPKNFGSTIIQDNNGTFWEFFADKVFQTKQNGTKEIIHKIRNVDGLIHASMYDPDINALIYWTSKKLFQYDLNHNKLNTHNLKNAYQDRGEGYCITKTINGHYWIGTSFGLIQAIPNEGKYVFELWETGENEQKGLLNNQVASLLRDPTDGNILWIGTKGGGLHRLDIRDMSWSHVNSKNGLPNDVIYGVLNDEHGNLWMSSNKGIIRYNPSTGDIKNFTAADGMQSDEFNTNAYAKGPDGTLYFGGINGLNVFHPDDLQDNPVTPTVLITDLKVNNEYITVGDSTNILEEAIHFTTEITLPYSQNNITLEFAALEFTTPSKNRFRYYLEGAEKEWAHESSENIAPYLNLSPGNYTFKIKGANGDGVWSEEVTSLKIKILPPWYRTNLAYLIYLVLLGLGIWRFWKFRESRLRLRYDMEMEQQKVERLEELDNMKSRFFTNISHEFRTPLTIISGMVDQIRERPDEWTDRGTTMIKRNTMGLLRLVNQILDLRKMESGALQLDMVQGNIIPYLQYILESFHSHAENRNIKLHFSATQPSFIMDYDPDKIQKILSNLISNAIRYSKEETEVFLTVIPQQNNGTEVLEIRVRDTGIGIPPDKLPHIFDRFYQVDDSSTRKGEGSGIGLTFTRELIRALDGQIQVESEVGKGSLFKVLLPVTRDAVMSETEKEYQSSTVGEFIPLLKTEGPIDVQQHIENGQQANLLIVEDNPDIVRYLISCLEGHYQIEVAVDGQEGIEKAIEQVPDIIISDVMMPRKNGFELCAALKEDVRTSHIPIVLLTAKADVDSRIQGLERGADVYLAKPFNKEELFIRLRKLIELRQRLQQRYSDLEVQQASEDIALQKEDEFIIQLRTLIHEHLDEEEYGISEICRDAAMSRAQLHRKIKALTGRSTSHFIRLTRLIKAKELLLGSNLTISEIAYEVGFSSPKYFSQVFSEEFGQAPREFLRNQNNN